MTPADPRDGLQGLVAKWCKPDYYREFDARDCATELQQHLAHARPEAVEVLTKQERKVLQGDMQSAEYEAGDVQDVCPPFREDEDAYWAWHRYHGLRKALATLTPERAP